VRREEGPAAASARDATFTAGASRRQPAPSQLDTTMETSGLTCSASLAVATTATAAAAAAA